MPGLARLENSARVLAVVKLANVALILLWGFAVTYVFVRLLPLQEFRAFLLLVAFGNFTISAELGLTTIIYNRLRRFWLGRQAQDALSGEGASGDFRPEELGVLVGALALLMVAGTGLVLCAMLAGIIATDRPLLFLLFFLTACLNLFATLSKRALAAVDRNLLWEIMDIGRRIIVLLLLVAALRGMNLTLSVFLQLLLSLSVITGALFLLHRRLGMAGRHWRALRVGGGHVRRHYLADFGASAAFTLSEVAAYNAPYFLIVLATHDPGPLLLFDFMFKVSRSLSALVRATVEAALPRLTAAWYRGDAPRFAQMIRRALIAAGAMALAIGAGLLLAGGWLVHHLFAGKLIADQQSLALIALLLLALSVICVSVYVQGALGRFRRMLGLSLPFLAGSLLSVPVAAFVAAQSGWPFATLLMLCLTATFVLAGALHAAALRRLTAQLQASPQ